MRHHWAKRQSRSALPAPCDRKMCFYPATAIMPRCSGAGSQWRTSFCFGDLFRCALGEGAGPEAARQLAEHVNLAAAGFALHDVHRRLQIVDPAGDVVSGEGEYRFGEKVVPVRGGDIVAAPAGTQAHQLINTGSHDLRYLGISTVAGVDVVDYPDSKKIAVAAGIKNADFKTATYVGLGRIAPADYYDGEDD